jgi:hypothetical protein
LFNDRKIWILLLASLQEEVSDYHRRRDFKKTEPGYHSKPYSKNPLPLSAPPLRDKPNLTIVADDTWGSEATKLSSQAKSKAAALRAYRRAMGLCYKCNEKWGKEHKCAPMIQLNAVQELWDLFQSDDDASLSPGSSNCSSDQLFLALSRAAVSGAEAPRTVKL